MQNESSSYPCYLDLARGGKLRHIKERLLSMLEKCSLCPRQCGANRLRNETCTCGVGRLAIVSSAHPHFGEESVLVGKSGSGTIFFAGCNLKCTFCQNYEISHDLQGSELEPEKLASLMLRIEDLGCHNLNLVTPTHVVPQTIEALEIAIEHGFDLPIVYNTGGYDSVETLKLLDGIIDIYMPDIKFFDEEVSERLTGARDYPRVVRRAIAEMHGQVGDLSVSENGIARRGLLVRHLVLPGMMEDTERIVSFIAQEISPHTFINIMNQYRPEYRAASFPPLDRRTTLDEWREAIRIARAAGLHRFDEC